MYNTKKAFEEMMIIEDIIVNLVKQQQRNDLKYVTNLSIDSSKQEYTYTITVNKIKSLNYLMYRDFETLYKIIEVFDIVRNLVNTREIKHLKTIKIEPIFVDIDAPIFILSASLTLIFNEKSEIQNEIIQNHLLHQIDIFKITSTLVEIITNVFHHIDPKINASFDIYINVNLENINDSILDVLIYFDSKENDLLMQYTVELYNSINKFSDSLKNINNKSQILYDADTNKNNFQNLVSEDVIESEESEEEGEEKSHIQSEEIDEHNIFNYVYFENEIQLIFDLFKFINDFIVQKFNQ